MVARIAVQNLKDISEAIVWARDEGKGLETYTGGTKRAMGRPLVDAYELCLGDLTGILSYEPEEGFISLRPAVRLEELEGVLAERGQWLGFEPPRWGGLFALSDWGESSCGGVIGGNLSGPRHLVAGAARDHLLGFRGISGRGLHFRSGGWSPRHVTGYDVSKLMAGSWGTLAVLYEVTLRTFACPELSYSLFLHEQEEREALLMMERLLRLGDGMSGAVYIPADVARVWPGIEREEALTVFRVEGTVRGVEAVISDLRKRIDSGVRTSTSEQEESERFWRSVRDLDIFSARYSDIAAPLWRILTPPASAVHVIGRLTAVLDDMVYFIDWGGGLIWLCHDISGGVLGLEDFIEKAGQIRHICLESGAEAILIRADEVMRARVPFYPVLPAPLAALTARIKHAFDPRGIFNSGRIHFGI